VLMIALRERTVFYPQLSIRRANDKEWTNAILTTVQHTTMHHLHHLPHPRRSLQSTVLNLGKTRSRASETRDFQRLGETLRREIQGRWCVSRFGDWPADRQKVVKLVENSNPFALRPLHTPYIDYSMSFSAQRDFSFSHRSASSPLAEAPHAV
jgi:hypothetical protein